MLGEWSLKKNPRISLQFLICVRVECVSKWRCNGSLTMTKKPVVSTSLILDTHDTPLSIAGFQCHATHIDQSTNLNHSIDKLQNLEKERRHICKHSRQDSGHSKFS